MINAALDSCHSAYSQSFVKLHQQIIVSNKKYINKKTLFPNSNYKNVNYLNPF